MNSVLQINHSHKMTIASLLLWKMIEKKVKNIWSILSVEKAGIDVVTSESCKWLSPAKNIMVSWTYYFKIAQLKSVTSNSAIPIGITDSHGKSLLSVKPRQSLPEDEVKVLLD